MPHSHYRFTDEALEMFKNNYKFRIIEEASLDGYHSLEELYSRALLYIQEDEADDRITLNMMDVEDYILHDLTELKQKEGLW